MKNMLDVRKYVTASVKATELGYGIQIKFPDGTVRIFPDVSSERKAAEKMTRMINDGKVSVLHINDIIEDMLE